MYFMLRNTNYKAYSKIVRLKCDIEDKLRIADTIRNKLDEIRTNNIYL